LTRLGFGSKAVITGDVTQIDLPTGARSGLVEARELLKEVEGIAFVHFTERDVVRHPLVQDIIRAYDSRRPRRVGPEAEPPPSDKELRAGSEETPTPAEHPYD
jgi:phosphate starvation-inducible PhoH-like protein